MIAQKEMVDVRDIPEYLWVREHQESIWQQDELLPMAEIHRRYARHVLQRTDGNKAQTARILGINRATLYRLLNEDKEYPEEK
jgi:DNA-binding NtrC family response regulator